MDNELHESMLALRTALAHVSPAAVFGRADAHYLDRVRERFNLPRRYVAFLAEHDPIDVHVRTPAEHITLVPLLSLDEEQVGSATDSNGKLLTSPNKQGFRPSWFIVARSALLGDPYFLDTSQPDAEGDCPVYTAMSGTETWQAKLCASSFALFLQNLAAQLELARDFDLDAYDPDDERAFREALAPRIRAFDPAAVKVGHWT